MSVQLTSAQPSLLLMLFIMENLQVQEVVSMIMTSAGMWESALISYICQMGSFIEPLDYCITRCPHAVFLTLYPSLFYYTFMQIYLYYHTCIWHTYILKYIYIHTDEPAHTHTHPPTCLSIHPIARIKSTTFCRPTSLPYLIHLYLIV